MIFYKILSGQSDILRFNLVEVEVDVVNGTYAFSVVGIPDKAVQEARDRISSAIKNCDFRSPKSKNQKVTILLAPADLRKEGPHFDLAMALAYLLSTDQMRFDPKGRLFLGELALDGTLRSIKGALPLVMGAKKCGIKEIFIPYDNKDEVSVVSGIEIFPARHLKEVIEHLNEKSIRKGDDSLNEIKRITPIEPIAFIPEERSVEADLKDIKGQEGAKRALEIAAAGGHNIMMYGPPGTGKTMLARAFTHLLPGLSFEQSLEVTSIHSHVGFQHGLMTQPPFRSPHHTSSYVSIIGGGTYPKPGEATLAHQGVLFMDEFAEFESRVIESLRQPLEDRMITISRAKTSMTFPSDFILVASMNPCPCGYLGARDRSCSCTPSMLQRYRRKISGPIVDRIDIWVEVERVNYEKLGGEYEAEATGVVRERIQKARAIQSQRLEFQSHVFLNGRMSSKNLADLCVLTSECRKLLDDSAKKLKLSPRAYHRIIKISRTIADLDNEKEIKESHILEALQYRPKLKLLE